MMFTNRRTIIIAVTISLTLISTFAESGLASIRKEKGKSGHGLQARRTPSKTVYGFALGLFGASDVTVDRGSQFASYNYPLKSGYSFSAFIDFPSRTMTTAGISLELHRISPEGIKPEISKTMIDLSLNIKANLSPRTSSVKVKPTLALGYGRLPAVSYSGYEVGSSNFMLIKGMLELTRKLNPDRPVGLLFQIGVIASPYGRGTLEGSNHSVTIKSGARLLMRFGVSF